MISTRRHLTAASALFAATLALPDSQRRALDAHADTAPLPVALAAVAGDIDRIQHRQDDLRQRLRRLESTLIALERQFRHLEGDSAAAIAWREPELVGATPRPAAASSLALQIDVPDAPAVPDASPQPVAAIAAVAPVAIETAVAAAPVTAPVSAPTAPAATASAAAPDVIDVMDAPPALDELLAVNDAALGEMRGGFTAPNGLEISFGIERAVYVNGALVTVTSLNLSDLSKQISNSVANSVSTALAAAGIGAAQNTAPTNGTGIPAAATSTQTGAAATATATAAAGDAIATAVASSGAASSEAIAASTPAPTAQTAAAGATAIGLPSGVSVSGNSVALIQSGAGNAVHTAFDAAAIGTIVQNALDNQKIQNVTVINATVNSLDILKSLNLQSVINSAITDSLNR